jgi:hypothetical protein
MINEFERTGANQNIDPEYVKMVGGVSEELLDEYTLPDPIRIRKAKIVFEDKMEWIRCSDQPAPKDKPFLGYILLGYHHEGLKDTRKTDIQVIYWVDSKKKFEEGCNCSGPEFDKEDIEVKAWMPLPNPPEDI